MSQKKVDEYKKRKRNRKQIEKKERMEERIRKAVVVVVGLLLCAWIIYSIVNSVSSKSADTVKMYEIDSSSIYDYSEKIEDIIHEDKTESIAEEETEDLTESSLESVQETAGTTTEEESEAE